MRGRVRGEKRPGPREQSVGCRGKVCSPGLTCVVCEGADTCAYMCNTFAFIYTYVDTLSLHNEQACIDLVYVLCLNSLVKLHEPIWEAAQNIACLR